MENRKILIVDDEKDFVIILNKILKKQNYLVSVAYDGEDGLKKIFEIKPDLVILDLNMPKMNGYEVCKKVREKFSFKDVAILFLTVRTLEKDFLEGFSCGSDDYIVKPFDTRELLTRINNLLKEKFYEI